MNNVKKYVIISILLPYVVLNLSFCNQKFVKRDEIKVLQKKYSGEYFLLKKIETSNNESLKKGSRIKIYFRSGSHSIKAYAYPYNEDRETVMGDNILYLFDNEFEKKKYNRESFEKKLAEIIKKAR